MDIEKYRYQKQNQPKKKKLFRDLLILFVALIFLFYGIFMTFSKKENNSEIEITKTVNPNENQPELKKTKPTDPNEKIFRYTIREGDIPADVFQEQAKFNANDTLSLIKSAEEVYDFSNLKIGQTLYCYFYKNEEKASKIEYDKNSETQIVAKREGSDFTVEEKQIDYEISQETATGEINNFFYLDAMNAGLSERTIIEIADVFSFDIDFMTEIQIGDKFSVVYEKRTRNGEDAPDGKVLAAKFFNKNENYYSYYYDNDGKGGHYDSEGRVLVRQFLRAPLSYSRITSGYTGARLHPITRKISAHYQIDYAAPTGTPVVASARGTVYSVGWEGGWGKIVRVRHDNGYTSHYGHLSAFTQGIRSGSRVAQGQLVGFVGSTGWSTGPHLDYGIKLNGSPVNPLALNLPKGEPLTEEKMPEFEELKNNYNQILDEFF
jgi:murein DD-endopeptidase MepM/ murein hydrolase activator NlpD